MLETSGTGMQALVLLLRDRFTDTWAVEWTLLSTRGLPVPQRASECASLPGHRWPSHLCHDLRGHLLPLYHILHVYPGIKISNLEFTTATCCHTDWVAVTNRLPPDRGSSSNSIGGHISRISGTCWSWQLSFSPGVLCLSSSRELYWGRGTLRTTKTTKISKWNQIHASKYFHYHAQSVIYIYYVFLNQ